MTKLGGTLSRGLALVSVIGLAACATTSPTTKATAANPVAARPYPKGIQCVWQPQLRNGYYNVIDHKHLVIESLAKQHYLLTLQRYCMDLESAINVGFDTHGGQLCAPGDSVVTPQDRCPISYLEPVASVAEAKALIAARAAVQKNKEKQESKPTAGQ